MITDELRPTLLDDVDGQPLAVKLLKALAANPDLAPKCLLLHGPHGVGKTSAGRAFAHAVNKVEQPDGTEKYVGEYNCATFGYEIIESGVYMHKASIATYMEESIKYHRDHWEIVIFDEIQGASHSIQTEMLKLMERVPQKAFFIFCTTDLDKLIPTLVSRCLLVEFQSISYSDVYNNLDKYGRETGQEIPHEVKSLIATRSNGHMRDAHIELSKYLLVGEKDYISGTTSYYGLIANVFIAAHKGEKNSVVNALNQLSAKPLFNVKREFENFMIDCGNVKYTGEKTNLSDINRLLDEYGDDFMDIVDFYTGIWDNSLFGSDRHFYMHMLSFFKDMEKKRSKTV